MAIIFNYYVYFGIEIPYIVIFNHYVHFSIEIPYIVIFNHYVYFGIEIPYIVIFNHYVYFGIEIPYIVACIDIFVESLIIWVGKDLIFKSFYEHSKLLENPNSQLSKLEFKFGVLRMHPNFHLMWKCVCILLNWPQILVPFTCPIPTWKSLVYFILRDTYCPFHWLVTHPSKGHNTMDNRTHAVMVWKYNERTIINNLT